MTKEYDIEGRNPWELEPYYCRHVSAMTVEGLHSKSDIACELAFRDKRIAELEANAKPYGYISSMCERDISKGNSCPLYPARDEEAGYTIPLFTTAKPVPDQMVLRDYIRSYGYTTNGQSSELATAIVALLNGEEPE